MNQRLRRSPPDVVYTPIDVTSMHMPASGHNIDALHSHGINKFVLLLRDPRDVVVSYYHHVENEGPNSFLHMTNEYYELEERDKIAYLVKLLLPKLVEFINSWDSPSPELGDVDVLKLYYRDMVQDPHTHFAKILDFYQIPSEVFDRGAIGTRKGVRFREGTVGRWKQYFDGVQTELASVILSRIHRRTPMGGVRKAEGG